MDDKEARNKMQVSGSMYEVKEHGISRKMFADSRADEEDL